MLRQLLERVRQAKGSDPGLDAEIAARLGLRGNTATSRPSGNQQTSPSPAFTSSIDDCLDLVRRMRPDWAWHIGWDAEGVLPYVTLLRCGTRFEARAATVPLAILDVLLQVEIAARAERAPRTLEQKPI